MNVFDIILEIGLVIELGIIVEDIVFIIYVYLFFGEFIMEVVEFVLGCLIYM